MDKLLLIEIVSVVFGLVFLLLLMRENIWCWIFGITSSALSVYLFIAAKLYSESILYAFYIAVGIYGWYTWNRGGSNLPIIEWKRWKIILAGSIGLAGSALLAWFFSTFTDANNPYLDATTTSFSFVASFLEAHKVLSTWWFWIAINGASIYLYLLRDLEIYSGLMVVYFILSIVGYLQWKKRMNQLEDDKA
jgi:nicotinamide mononucleotide transporter